MAKRRSLRQSSSEAPPSMAPMVTEPASSTEVLSSIMCMYSTTETFGLRSKSMSYCCPSHTSSAMVLKVESTCGSRLAGTLLNRR